MAVAVIGVCLLGISKGGFLGLGVMALPLMSLFVPPLQAAAIILPTAVAQDFLTLWIYRREWSAWNLKIMLPSMFAGMFIAWLLAASLSSAHIRLAIGLIATLGFGTRRSKRDASQCRSTKNVAISPMARRICTADSEAAISQAMNMPTSMLGSMTFRFQALHCRQ